VKREKEKQHQLASLGGETEFIRSSLTQVINRWWHQLPKRWKIVGAILLITLLSRCRD